MISRESMACLTLHLLIMNGLLYYLTQLVMFTGVLQNVVVFIVVMHRHAFIILIFHNIQEYY